MLPLLLLSHSVVPDSWQPHGMQPARLLCPWNSPSKNTGVGCHALLQGIFPTQGLNPGLLHWASLVAQSVKNLPAVRETQVWSLGWEDPLEKEMATHSSIPAWEFHGQRRLVGYSPWGCNSWTWLSDSLQLNSLPYSRQILYHWASREAHLARQG